MRRTTNRAWLVLGSVYFVFAGCKVAKAPDSDPDGGQGAGAHSSGASSSHGGSNGAGAGAGAGNNPGTGASATTGGTDSGGSGAGMGTGGVGTLALDSVTGSVVGRYGDDVRFVVEGSLPEGQEVSLALRFESTSGSATDAFDSDFDGEIDSAAGRIAFDAPIVAGDFTATATLRGIAKLSGMDVAFASLYEVGGESSDEIEVEIEAQAQVQLGEPCDPDFVESRCGPGLGCAGDPAQCSAASAPTLEKVAYLHSTGGPVLLARGTEPDDDLETLTINFRNSSNQPVLVDLDNDDIPESSSLDIEVEDLVLGTPFLVKNQSAEGFEDDVPKVEVIAGDSNSNFSEPKTASIGNPASRSTGQACDQVFDQCSAQGLCVTEGDSYMGTCQAGKTARTARCNSASALDPSKGRVLAVGRTSGTSFWNAPLGCIADLTVGRPEGIAVLTLDTDVDTLTVTTANPETNFDTVLYVVPACPDTLDDLLGCNDDADGFASTLVLTDVAAGTYLIVIDSTATGGGSYGVSVSIE